MKQNLLFFLLVAMVLLASCSSPVVDAGTIESDAPAQVDSPVEGPGDDTATRDPEEDVERPAGWSEATHGQDAAANYDVVFPQDEVNRIDIVVDPADWQSLLDNMTELYGAAGTQSERMPGQPREGGAPGQPPEGFVPPEGGAPGQPPEGFVPPEGGAPGQPPEGRPGGGLPGGGVGGDSDVNPDYIPVTISFEGNTWTHVGLRFKGNSSLRSAWGNGIMKLPMRLDFDQFEDQFPETEDQRFYGFKQLSLSSGFNDASFLREKVAADVFRAAGVPAAQTAFYEVYVDYGEGPVYFGLYTMVEIVEDTLIETQFEDDDGNVYKPSGSGATFAAGLFNPASFDKQTNADEGDWSDVQALFDALHASTRTTDPAAWRSGLEAVFDVDGFLNWLAVNAVIQNWDTYGNMSHNYYLYHDPTTDLLTWIPWDNNEALSSRQRSAGVLSLSLDDVDAQWPLIRYLMDDPVYHAQYVAYVEAVSDGPFEPARMEATYRELAELIEPYALAENEGYSYFRSDEAFYTAIEELVDHAYSRAEAAEAYLATQR
ncbi:MAG: CotH kinase family protein [Anaerolineae bacterium]|nr:CotH kinase family protein [Anaerolineae bacterium]